MGKPKWNGPKEWRPGEFLGDTVLLSEEEKIRLRKIRKAGGQASPEDILWTLEIVRRLSEIGPDDYVFPDYLALVNQIAGNAFALGFVREFDISNRTVCLEPTQEVNQIQILEYTLSCQIHQAVLAVRPYFRVTYCQERHAIAELQKLTLKIAVDDSVLVDEPLTPHLIDQDRSFFGKTRRMFRVRKDDSLFPACHLDDERRPDIYQPQGIFCCNGTLIRAWLIGKLSFTATCSFGIVAGLYSTKSNEVTVAVPLDAPDRPRQIEIRR